LQSGPENEREGRTYQPDHIKIEKVRLNENI
jgi:hypothetical protein